MRTSPAAHHRRPSCRVALAPLPLIALMICATACGGSDDSAEARDHTGAEAVDAGAATDGPRSVGVLTAGMGTAEPGLVGGVVGDETPPDDAVFFTRVPRKPGDQFTSDTRLDIKLDATVGVGFFSQDMAYRREEEERVVVRILPEEDGALRRSLEFKKRRTTSTLPLVGKKVKDRRAAGKTLTVTSKDGKDTVYNKSGAEVKEKVATEVGYSLRILGTDAVFHSVLPDGDEVFVVPGKTISVEAEDARRIVGLPFEELNVDALQLTLRRPAKPDAPLAVFDASASFSGNAILGDSHLALTASLSGEVSVVRKTGRIASVDLKGHVDAQHEAAPGSEGGLLSATGNGPLTIRRRITAD